MKTQIYNLSTIANNNKTLIYCLKNKELNDSNKNNFANLFNNTQKLMLETVKEFLLNKKERENELNLITVKPYINNVVEIVEKTLFEIYKELNLKFDTELIKYIRTEKYN